jgi:hypothetical protein
MQSFKMHIIIAANYATFNTAGGRIVQTMVAVFAIVGILKAQRVWESIP